MADKDEKALEAYKKTINKIDDWFEYMNESKKDREFIHTELDKLTEKLKLIYSVKQDPIYCWFGADTYYKCEKHDIPYPKGATCPRCESKN